MILCIMCVLCRKETRAAWYNDGYDMLNLPACPVKAFKMNIL